MRNKYGAKKVTTADGEKFDSIAEYKRYLELRMLERCGEISELKRQVAFVLAPAFKFDAASRTKPAIRYIADFVYFEKGKQVVEDVKVVETDVFRLKYHSMATVHGIQVKLTGC